MSNKGKKKVQIEIENPTEFFGPKHSNYYHLIKYFKDIDINTRGNKISLNGEKEKVSYAVEKINEIIKLIKSKKSINESTIDAIMNNSFNKEEKIILYNKEGKPIKALTPNQQKIVDLVEENDMVFVIGPAGTGKTYTAIALAVKALKTKQVKKIILSRPAVEAGESIGFLPGNIKEKLDPYLQPLYDALYDILPSSKLDEYINEKVIEIAPLGFMRGRTLDNAFVILDEAQNSTISQIKMFLTRMGVGAKFIITGDITQIDLTDKSKSGLIVALEILKDVEGIGFVFLNESDIVRHNLVKKIVKSFDDWFSKKVK